MPTMKTERSGNASSRCPSLETIQGMSAGDVRWRCGDRDVGTDSEFMTSCASSESVLHFPCMSQRVNVRLLVEAECLPSCGVTSFDGKCSLISSQRVKCISFR